MTPATPVMPRLGLTTMSFAREIHLGLWDLDDCLARAGELGPGTGLEITGAQSLPGYPAPAPQVVEHVRALVEQHALVPVCYDAYLERGRRHGQVADDAEAVALVVAELELAHRLGFPMVRLNAATPAILTALLPHAQRLELRVVVELHATYARSPEGSALIAFLDEAGTDSLGLLQDLGAMMRAVPVPYLEAGLRGGRSERVVALVRESWNAAVPREEALAAVAAVPGSTPADVEWAFACYVMFHRVSVDDLVLVLPHLAHVHGKFFRIEEGEEPAIDYRAALTVLARAGFRGVISSEYLSWDPADRLDTFAQVAAHHAMVRRIWNDVTQEAAA